MVSVGVAEALVAEVYVAAGQEVYVPEEHQFFLISGRSTQVTTQTSVVLGLLTVTSKQQNHGIQQLVGLEMRLQGVGSV